MYLTPQEQREQMVAEVIIEQRISILAAAYSVYVQLTPNNKKPISQREFYTIFKDNWQNFNSLEIEET